ncbi:hypothetical protein DTQ70_07135 [Runella sp. SP2]|nr:hypothetical protein DTQ70_07135 [Runella sp. SP2]
MKKKEASFKPQNFTKMTAQQFAHKVEGIANNFTNAKTTKEQFKHAIQDLLHEVVYNDEELKKHYYQMYENEAKAWEYQTLVSH